MNHETVAARVPDESLPLQPPQTNGFNANSRLGFPLLSSSDRVDGCLHYICDVARRPNMTHPEDKTDGIVAFRQEWRALHDLSLDPRGLGTVNRGLHGDSFKSIFRKAVRGRRATHLWAF